MEKMLSSWRGMLQIKGIRRYRFLKFFLNVCAFIMFSGACNDLAFSHPGLAPEIDRITHKIEKDPRNVDLLIERGQLLRSNDDLLNALRDFDRAVELDSNNTEILFQRGLTLTALKRDVKAEMDLTNFLDKDEQKAPLFNKDNSKRGIAIAERAQIRARTGRANLALTDFNSAIRLLPVSGLYHARGLFQELLGNLPEAASGYREALSRIPNSILLKKSLIRVEVDRKRFNQALDLIDEVLVRVSVKRSWYLLQGDVLTRMGKPEAARAAREKALAEVNQAMSQRLTAIHRFSRAKVYVALGRIDAAKQDLQLAIQMAPSFTESKDLLNQLEGS